MNILHLFSISIIVSGSICHAFALDTSKTCDANTLPHYGPHNPSHIYIKDTSGNLPYIPLTDHTAILHDDDVWNIYPESRIVHVTLTIQNQDTGQLVFNQTQRLQMQACSGPESVKWRFVPIQVANYIATVSDNRDKEGMIFNSILDAAKSQTVSSPLEQLRFGMDSRSVVCKQDLHLVIKSEDGSPACVKPDTASKLVERGWRSYESSLDSIANHEKNGTISGDISVFMYGGPYPGNTWNQSVHYEIDVYATDGVTIVGKTFSDANAHYSIQLPVGNYIIYPYSDHNQTHLVSVSSDKNTVFNISYRTDVP